MRCFPLYITPSNFHMSIRFCKVFYFPDVKYVTLFLFFSKTSLLHLFDPWYPHEFFCRSKFLLHEVTSSSLSRLFSIRCHSGGQILRNSSVFLFLILCLNYGMHLLAIPISLRIAVSAILSCVNITYQIFKLFYAFLSISLQARQECRLAHKGLQKGVRRVFVEKI